ncbi:TPM domain-containing protein [Kocuria rhizophila]|nr:TPM domain-containing protein [Kocuria rhizophila]
MNDTQGEDIEEFSRKVATDWAWADGRNNGALVVADMGERELRIEVADAPSAGALGLRCREDDGAGSSSPGSRTRTNRGAFTTCHGGSRPGQPSGRRGPAGQATPSWRWCSALGLGGVVTALLLGVAAAATNKNS